MANGAALSQPPTQCLETPVGALTSTWMYPTHVRVSSPGNWFHPAESDVSHVDGTAAMQRCDFVGVIIWPMLLWQITSWRVRGMRHGWSVVSTCWRFLWHLSANSVPSNMHRLHVSPLYLSNLSSSLSQIQARPSLSSKPFTAAATRPRVPRDDPPLRLKTTAAQTPQTKSLRGELSFVADVRFFLSLSLHPT